MSKFNNIIILLSKYDNFIKLLIETIEDLYVFKSIEYNDDGITIEYESYDYRCESKTFNPNEIEILLKNFKI